MKIRDFLLIYVFGCVCLIPVASVWGVDVVCAGLVVGTIFFLLVLFIRHLNAAPICLGRVPDE